MSYRTRKRLRPSGRATRLMQAFVVEVLGIAVLVAAVMVVRVGPARAAKPLEHLVASWQIDFLAVPSRRPETRVSTAQNVVQRFFNQPLAIGEAHWTALRRSP